MASLRSVFLLVGTAASPVRAAIAAWWNGIGPQIMLQNETTGLIRYSACNSNDQPTYSYTDDSVFSLVYKPKNGTALAGTGWWTNVITVASIFYIDEQGNIANALFNCDMSTGLFQSQGNWIVSHDVPSIHPDTGLAAILLGAEAGYRVYYHDSDGAINELGYTTKDDWHHRGIVSHDINALPALAAAFTGKDNITVASPRDGRDIAVTRWDKDQTWHRSTLPHPLKGSLTTSETNRSDIAVNETAPTKFSLPAWDGKTKGIGISIDSDDTRFLWYIGNDSSLYSVADRNSSWSPQASQSNAFWPLADTPNGELAVAQDSGSSMVRLYYLVKGQLSEIKFENKAWKAWSTVPAPTQTQTQSSTPIPTSPQDTTIPANTGLSTGAKAGIGVGVSLGALGLGAIIAVIVLVRRKNRARRPRPPFPEEDTPSTALGPGTPAPSYHPRASAAPYDNYTWDQKASNYPLMAEQQQVVYQLDGAAKPAELDAPPRPMYELPDQVYSHEVMAEPPQRVVEQGH
ncbi:hypothetical protein VTK56DRAFT_2170 [Thermocarpiscus australiensis]